MSDKTKAELLEEIEVLRERLDDTRAKDAPRVERVPEADALAACVRAIDQLEESSSGRQSFDPYVSRRSQSDTERVLRTLASRYGVDLFTVEFRQEPCSRRHVDDLDMGRIADALRSGAAYPVEGGML